MSISEDLWVPITSHCSRKRPKGRILSPRRRPNPHLPRCPRRPVIKVQKTKRTRPKSTILSRPFKRIWRWKVTQVMRLLLFLKNWATLISNFFSVEDHFAKALGDTWVKLQKAEEEKRSEKAGAKKSENSTTTETKKPTTLLKASS